MSACYLTTQGRVLLAKMLASDRLVYTRAVTSSATVAEPDKLTALPMEQQTARFIYCEQVDEACRLTVAFNCRDLEDSYQLKMLGIYAKSESDQNEVLYKVLVYDTNEEHISLPAGQDISYKFIITDAVSEGELTVEIADDLAAPAEHVANPYRHLFVQTNATLPAIVDCGERNSFADGQKIVFVPRIALTANSSQMSLAGKRFTIKCIDLANHEINHIFVANQTYVLTYRSSDDCFFYVKHEGIEYKDGVGHVWNGETWQTIIEAGRIVASVSGTAPAGTILCDGSSLERGLYPELFAAIGDTFGAVDDDHFNVPDLGGRCLIGSNTVYTLGSIGGAAAHQLSLDELPTHAHNYSFRTSSESHSHSISGSVGNGGEHTHTASGTTDYSSHSHSATVLQNDAGGHTHTINNASSGSSGGHSHRNGIVDDDTSVFYYNAEPLNCSSHRAVASDSNPMPHPHQGITSNEGSHTHTINVSLNSVGNHGHNVRVEIPSGGNHRHSYNATTSKNGAHSHSTSFNIGAAAHSHTCSGATGNVGANHAHTNLQPYMAINYFIYTGRSLL